MWTAANVSGKWNDGQDMYAMNSCGPTEHWGYAFGVCVCVCVFVCLGVCMWVSVRVYQCPRAAIATYLKFGSFAWTAT